MNIESFEKIPEDWIPLKNIISEMFKNIKKNPGKLQKQELQRLQNFKNFLIQYEEQINEKIAIPESFERTEFVQEAQELKNVNKFLNEVINSGEFIELQNLKKMEKNIKELIINDLAPPDDFIIQIDKSATAPKGYSSWDSWKKNKIKFGDSEITFKDLKGIKEIEELRKIPGPVQKTFENFDIYVKTDPFNE